MSLEFFGRLQKELSITGNALYESVLSVAERVNRKVHVLRLHGQAASLLTQIETIQGHLGRHLSSAITHRHASGFHAIAPPSDPERSLIQATEQVRHLKQTLVQVDAKIRELKLEAIHEDLLRLQRDLSLREAAIERIPISLNAQVIGKPLGDLPWPPSVRVVTILRGPFLVQPSDGLMVRADDILVLIGLRTELDHVSEWFAPARTVKSA